MRDISNKSFRLHAEISLSADLQKQQKFYYINKADDKKYEESIIKWILDSYQHVQMSKSIPFTRWSIVEIKASVIGSNKSRTLLCVLSLESSKGKM